MWWAEGRGVEGWGGRVFDVMFEETDQRNDTLLFPCVVFLAAPRRNWALPAPLAKSQSQNSPRFVLALLGLFWASWQLEMVWEFGGQLQSWNRMRTFPRGLFHTCARQRAHRKPLESGRPH